MPIIPENRPKLDPAMGEFADSEGLLFHRMTEFHPEISQSDFRTIAKFNDSANDAVDMRGRSKKYSYCPAIALQKGASRRCQSTFLESVQRRSSCRKFASQSLTIEELSAVLELGYGIRAEDGSRTVGSGGGLYPNEIYLFVSRVDGLRPGLYHYNVEDFSLELIDDSIDVAQVKLAFQDPTLDWDTLPALFFLTAIYPKTLKKYGMRGWRILMLDSGHLAQSFWLATSALGLGGTTLAGGLDGKIRRLLKINGHQEGYVCSFALGHVER